MYIPMPFPKCKNCGTDGSQGYHRICGGKLELDPHTENVRCIACGHVWKIWDSTYYCSCGNKYTAQNIDEAIVEMLSLCKRCVEEILKQQEACKKRERLSRESMREFLVGFFEKIGYVVGVAVGTIVETVLNFIFKE